MKLVMVPPGLVGPMLAALRFEGVDLYAEHGELPAIGGMPVLVSRHCPPDTVYILNAEAIPKLGENLPSFPGWAFEEGYRRYGGMTFAIDFMSLSVNDITPRRRPRTWRDRLHWRVWYAWFLVRDWWRTLVEESRSPFSD